MRFHALAIDYDGTLADHGRVAPATLAALERLAASGRKLILVTGRRLDDLLEIFPQAEMFDRIVVENGALLYRPKTKEDRLLGTAPPRAFIQALTDKRIQPLEIGKCIVATVQPYETVVLEAIRELGLELHVIFNKEAVMVLPSNVNKATGLKEALHELALSPHEVAAIGDAENDHAFLQMSEFAAAVANAVPMLKTEADAVMASEAGKGAAELIEAILRDDLKGLTAHGHRQAKRALRLGTTQDGLPVHLPSWGPRILIAGSSGGGKSTLATSLLEQLMTRTYQCCVIDPEGDYESLQDTKELIASGQSIIGLGSSKRGPEMEEIVTAIAQPGSHLVANLIGVDLQARPDYLATMLARLQELRVKTGRPHWILVDESHHVLTPDRHVPPMLLGEEGRSVIYVTVHPNTVAPEILKTIDIFAGIGDEANEALKEFCEVTGTCVPDYEPPALEQGQALIWWPAARELPIVVDVQKGITVRKRHIRKYAEGELDEGRSFYFRGPKNKLNLRAQNLSMFIQIADGVDDDTWQHHFRKGDYSAWLREMIKDDQLGDEVLEVEKAKPTLPLAEAKQRIKEIIERRYTLPASAATAPK